MEGNQLYAYVMLDLRQQYEDEKNIFVKYNTDNESHFAKTSFNDKLKAAGKFILLSPKEYDLEEIIPLYYSRLDIEQVFDMSKHVADILPLVAHSEGTLRGHLLIAFVVSVVYSSIKYGLNDSYLSAFQAIFDMHNLRITTYDTIRVLEDLSKNQKEVFSRLKLECPLPEQKGALITGESLLTKLKSDIEKRSRGRPMGSIG
ncbi:MAG: hypothetical protein LBG48_05625 [Rickettsiales bacterium]|jgi:transposase|nr:hypothetical protein [Rickettsiales bacterium]